MNTVDPSLPDKLGRRPGGLAPIAPLVRLKRVHALMTAGETIMAVALADSLFLSISPDAARTKVILFLAISMAPFAVVAPLVGPAIDRMPGGQRLVMVLVSLLRAVVMVVMMFNVDSLALFPLAFAALVLSKTYSIAKSALVPTTIVGDEGLVEANSKLGQIAGIVGFVVVFPAGFVQIFSTPATLCFGAVVFVTASVFAFQLPKDVVIADSRAERLEVRELHSQQVVRAANMMRILRGSAGFMFFHLAFWLRGETAGTAWFGIAVGFGALCTLGANTIAPELRRKMSVERMLLTTMIALAPMGLVAGFSGRILAGIALTGIVNGAAAIGRLAFESIVQRDAPDANRGRAFAQFETQNQMAWVLAGLLPVIFTPSGEIGFFVVAIAGLAGCVVFIKQVPRATRRSTAAPDARSISPEHPTR